MAAIWRRRFELIRTVGNLLTTATARSIDWESMFWARDLAGVGAVDFLANSREQKSLVDRTLVEYPGYGKTNTR